MGTQLEASEVLRGSWVLPSAGPKANTALNRNESQTLSQKHPAWPQVTDRDLPWEQCCANRGIKRLLETKHQKAASFKK